MIRLLLFSLVFTVFAVSGAMATDDPQMLLNESTYDPDTYILGPDDVVHVTVYNEPELSKDYKIDTRGMMAMPLIGEVQAEGLSPTELTHTITNHLSDGYFVNPSVSIEISEYKPIYIMGEVKAPGRYEFSPGMTVLNAAAIAGGFTYRANRKEAEILRAQSKNIKTSYEELPIESKLQGGDVVLIKERFF